MSADLITAVAATVAGVLMGVAPLLQARRVHERRRSDDVSVVWLLVLTGGGIVWLARGLVIGDVALVVANVVVVLASAVTLLVVLRHRGGAPSAGR